MQPLEIFLVAPPGLEPMLAEEARALGFAEVSIANGGVACQGDWRAAQRANYALRGASRVLARVAAFRAAHLSELDKRARRVDWAALIPPDAGIRVSARCRRSRIYHSGAAAERVANAIRAATGARIGAGASDLEAEEGGAEPSEIHILTRIDRDVCALSVDLSGALLHRRGHKQAVGKAPLRETMAALFLGYCGWRGTEPLLDPMCGSGTFLIEGAEIAAGLAPGRGRRFAFERLAVFDAEDWAALAARPPEPLGAPPIFGYDRDAGAIGAASSNAARAGVADRIRFAAQAISALERPECAPGLVIVNPPYGGRIGEKGGLKPLYAALGRTLLAKFSGWRAGLVTSEEGLARASGLPVARATPPIPHGGLRVRLFATDAL